MSKNSRPIMTSPGNDDPVIKQQNRFVLLLIGSALLAVGMVSFFFFFPGINETENFVAMAIGPSQGKPHIVGLYAITGHSEENGAYLKAYELRVIEPATATTVSTLRYERSLDFRPTDPELKGTQAGDVWVILPTQFIQDTTGFLRHATLAAEGTLKDAPVPELQGYQASTGTNGPYITVRNPYNETYCYDIQARRLQKDYCPWGEEDNGPGRFMLVSKEAGSTRSRLWYVRASKPIPQPEIRMGIVNGDQPLPGTHIFEDLTNNRGRISEERLAYFQSVKDEMGVELSNLSGTEYFVDAELLFQDSSIALLRFPSQKPESFQLKCFDNQGKTRWQVELTLATRDYPGPIVVQRQAGMTIVCDTKHWAIGVEEATGKQAWQYIP